MAVYGISLVAARVTDARDLLLGWAKSEGFAAIHNGQATDEQIVDDLLRWLDEHNLAVVPALAESITVSAGAPACEIEITDEMIDAGQAAADDYDARFERPSSLVISVYRAMSAVAPRPKAEKWSNAALLAEDGK